MQVKRGIYECLDLQHPVRFFIYDNYQNSVRYRFLCTQCSAYSLWIADMELADVDQASIERCKWRRPIGAGYVRRIGGLPYSPIREDRVEVNRIPTV